MLAAERALREGSELGPHAPALPPSPRVGGAEEALCPLSLSCLTCKEMGRLGVAASLLESLLLSRHLGTTSHVQCGATLPSSPGQPHLAQVGVAFLQQRLRFTDKISRGFLSSLRPPSLCWGPVFRPLPAGPLGEQNRGMSAQLWGGLHPLSCDLGLPSPRDVSPRTPHPTLRERRASQVASVLPSPGTRPQADRGNVESLFGSG